MGFDFHFRFAEDEKDRSKLVGFLLKQPFNYPNYEDWVGRAMEEVRKEWKDVVLAFSDDYLVADLISQPQKDFPKYLREIKNMRVHPKLRGRYFGAFMIRQAETEAKRQGYQGMICDVRSDNSAVITLLNELNYHVLYRTGLYDTKNEDIILVKPLRDNLGNEFFTPIKNKITSSAA